MAELIPKERLQPSLLDRLTDDEPDKRIESRDRRVLSLRQLRECVLRDLASLFNAGNLLQGQDLESDRRFSRGAEAVYLSDIPLVAHSVINYGLPDLAGTTAASLNVSAIESALLQAIWDFEPRVIRDTVTVQFVPAEEEMHRHNTLVFLIRGQLWGQRIADQLYLRTEIDLEIGEVRVTDQS